MANSDRFIQTAADKRQLDERPTCPKCGSRDASSAAKRPTPQSYWRCHKCGDVWNPAQLAGGSSKGWWAR